MTYQDFRTKITAAGGFSAFYAVSTGQIARWMDRLCKDPDVITATLSFPHTAAYVRRKGSHGKTYR